MKKLLQTVVLGTVFLGCAHAQSPNLPLSVFVEYHQNDAHSYDQSVYLSGVSFGLSTSPYASGFWGALDILKDDNLEASYAEARFGGHVNFVNKDGFYLNASTGLGYAIARSSLLYNDIEFVTIPIGLEAGFSLVPQLGVYCGVGYKWLLDITPNTAYDILGNADGVEFKAGMRFNL